MQTKFISEKDPNIWVDVLKYSINEYGQRIISIHGHVPRIILAEINTHRVFSRNSASSRAVPISKIIDVLKNIPFIPFHWGKKQSGMQAYDILEDYKARACERIWKLYLTWGIRCAEVLDKIGLHKQIVNRLLEAFQYTNIIITTTEMENFLNLRTHTSTEPHFQEFANCIKRAWNECSPTLLKYGEWHLPFIDTKRENGKLIYVILEETEDGWSFWREFDVDMAKKISASCCAQISYRKSDISMEKANRLWNDMVMAEPIHGSPFEHQATPLSNDIGIKTDDDSFEHVLLNCWEDGVTHVDRDGYKWSGNFRGWIQMRQLLEKQYTDDKSR